MALEKVVETANAAGNQLAKWAPVERILAAVCAASPLVMWWIDPEPLRESISAYFAMIENQWFYVPLAVAAMLFIVNGITKQAHWYNWVLGGALVGVLMFNTTDFGLVHKVFAITFFAGNAAVIIWWSGVPAKYRYAFAGAVGLAALVTAAAGVLTVWLAEFISLLIISAHFLLDSIDRWKWYNALPRGENPWSRANLRKSAPASARPTPTGTD